MNKFERLCRTLARRLAPPSLIQLLVPWIIKYFYNKNGCSIQFSKNHIHIERDRKTIILARTHLVQVPNVLSHFDDFFHSVESQKQTVDFSKPAWHKVNGYERHAIKLPAFAEHLKLANLYLDFAKLKPGDVVLDLGAYCGLTAILFDEAVGPEGYVIAVEADPLNYQCTQANFEKYNQHTERKINLCQAAIWKTTGEISFCSEGSMSSSATAIVGKSRGHQSRVPALTLSELAKRYKLERVDFIKCDIEGAERVIFDQPDFFEHLKPRIIIEPHYIEGKLTDKECICTLEKFGYQAQYIDQPGSDVPLLCMVFNQE